MAAKKDTAILLIVCPDQPGLVATVSEFVHQNGGNIVDLDQHTDYETSTFLMRIEWELKGFALDRNELEKSLQPLSKKFKMKYGLHFSSDRLRMALMVSQYRHCLYDLLVRCALEEIQVEIPLILSNHADLKDVARHFEIPFHVVEVSKENKREAEAKQIQLLEKHQIDLVVLARYMQILGKDFVDRFPHRIINIHHSFLPAFVGSHPYHQAYARGVKVIGATSHYVTEQLDQGPIIEQSVTRVTHLDRVEDMIRKGRDQEKTALAFAVRMHCEHRIATYGNKTVVFE
jgi:formyltetrahydrofolate deformylase